LKPLGSVVQSYDAAQTTTFLGDSLTKTQEPDEETQIRIRSAEELEFEKAFLENRIKLAKASDSVCLSIDLIDSVIYLDINGVTIRKCPLERIGYSRFLDLANHNEKLSWISEPFYLEDQIATIPKIPYIIKAAPKDTLEAQEQNSQPLPVDTTTVYFTLYFQRNLAIEVMQSEPPHHADKKLIRKYGKACKNYSQKRTSRAVLRGQVPESLIQITLEVSQADARAIYRGIPHDASLALRL
jgi:hypothetical protein